MNRRGFLGAALAALAGSLLPKLGAAEPAGPVVDGAGQTGSSLITDGWGGVGALKKGDVFTIEGVYSVNPLSYRETGRLQQFVVTEDATVSRWRRRTVLRISPAINTSGALQTVGRSPAHRARVIPWSGLRRDRAQSMVFHPDAYRFAISPHRVLMTIPPRGGA